MSCICKFELVEGTEADYKCSVCGRLLKDVQRTPIMANCPGSEHSTPSPSLAKKAWNIASALKDFASDKMALVDDDEYARRLEICDPCPSRRHGTCMECGCRLKFKARGRAFKCPLGKWDQELDSGD